jgi:uncharacterized protein YutE (UPF0331/DUF86 family)
MTPSRLRRDVVAERVAWVRGMISGLRDLPLADELVFTAAPATVAAAESYLRRALEALLDLGRHVLAKGFGLAVVEYKEIAVRLQGCQVLAEDEAALLRDMAGYRNRMVHFYDEVTAAELFDISARRLGEVERLLDAIVRWIDTHPEAVDEGSG